MAGKKGAVNTAGHRRTPKEVLDVLAVNSATVGDCIKWTGNLDKGGYGQMSWKPKGERKVVGAYRVAYRLAVGPIPVGFHLDHLCRNRWCINVDHLEVVTSRENTRRSPIAPAGINAAKTHCTRGHLFSPENTYRWTSQGRTHRICRTCRAEYERRTRQEKAA